jgi:hypothetical protein
MFINPQPPNSFTHDADPVRAGFCRRNATALELNYLKQFPYILLIIDSLIPVTLL